MVVFAVELQESEAVYKLVNKTCKALLMGGFVGSLRTIERPGGKLWLVANIKAAYPPVWRYIAVLLVGMSFVLNGFHYSNWMLLGLVPMSVELMTTASWHCAMLKRGLKKQGYAGGFRRVKTCELLEWVAEV